jgi:hypothetical protein
LLSLERAEAVIKLLTEAHKLGQRLVNIIMVEFLS